MNVLSASHVIIASPVATRVVFDYSRFRCVLRNLRLTSSGSMNSVCPALNTAIHRQVPIEQAHSDGMRSQDFCPVSLGHCIA